MTFLEAADIAHTPFDGGTSVEHLKAEPFSALVFIDANLAAQRIGEAAIVAYWVTGKDRAVLDHQVGTILNQFDKLSKQVALIRQAFPHLVQEKAS